MPDFLAGLKLEARVALEARFKEYERRLAALEQQPLGSAVQSSDFAPKPGQIVTAEPPPGGLTVLLPAARSQTRNARIAISARNSNPVRWQAVQGTVNGAQLVTSNAVGLVEAVCDGASWHVSQGAASPTGSVATTSGAKYFLETADVGLPNARIGTDSTEIDVDYSVASVVSWSLKASSVAFSKLQNLTGLSVLGRAANSTGVMAAVTASAADQYFRVNTAGTSLEWGNPASASVINSGGTFQRAALTGAITASQNSNATAFGALTAKSVLANATNASAVPAALAGLAAFQHLRVNSGNTGLEWSVLTSGDFPAGVVPLTALATQSNDTFVANVSGGVASPTAVNLSTLAGAGLVFGTHTLDVTAGAGASLVVTANDIQRGALTGAITAAQDSNATVFGALAAKSVLANATNASAAPSGLAGSAAFQYLRVNSGNTGLEWATLSTHASTSILYDAATNTFQHAALTGDVTASQNSNATTIANNAVSNAKLADMAQATIKLRATGAGTGDPIDGTISQALDMTSSTNGAMLARSSASGNIWAIVPNQANGRHCITDGSGVATWADPTTGSGGTLSLASTGSLSVVPDNDMDLTTGVGNGVGFSRNMNRCIWWEDFTVVQGLNVPAGFTYITCETGWVCTNSAGGTAVVSCFDGGATGTSVAPGELNLATSATLGTQIDFHKGLNNTTRWIQASAIRSIKFKTKLTSTASVHVALGLNIASFGSLDCARFDYDSSVAANWHVISANSGGATLNNTDTLIAATTNYVEFEIRSPSQSSLNWEYYMDGVLKATHTTTSKSRGVNLHFSIANLVAANKDLRIDYVSFETWPVR